MLCKIADLLVEVPEAGGMAPRLGSYAARDGLTPDFRIREEMYDIKRWPGLDPKNLAYMDSGWFFYLKLLTYDGLMLHASAVELDGAAYLFSGPSGMGKSTHTRLWKSVFPDARIFNDDKPALRNIDGVWYAYGTPWCGKNGININMKVPVAGICFLRRGEENSIKRLPPVMAAAAVVSQTVNSFVNEKGHRYMMDNVTRLVTDIPIYELYSKPEPEAALLSYNTMKKR